VGKLGTERAARSYAFKSILNAGVPLSGGSDWPIVDADPLAAMEAAVTRGGSDASRGGDAGRGGVGGGGDEGEGQGGGGEGGDGEGGRGRGEGTSGGGSGGSGSHEWDPSQRLTASEALTAYTTGAAHVTHLNGLVGLLWRGAFADFAVLDASPMDLGAEDRAEGTAARRKKPRPKVVATFVGGRCAFGCNVFDMGAHVVSSLSSVSTSTSSSPSSTATTTAATAAATVTATANTALAARRAQLERITSAPGFIAALDQSGGSTPRALATYGITLANPDDTDDMFRQIHDMRTRIVTSTAFNGDRVVGAILFEDTVMHRRVQGVPTATYLWREKRVVPFLKIDRGLEPETNGVQLMKVIPGLAQLLARCGGGGVGGGEDEGGGEGRPGKYIFGTKARSVIHRADAAGIRAVVAQQFALAAQVREPYTSSAEPSNL